jgi:hypothetical protein
MIAQGITVPGLRDEIDNRKEKEEWIKPLGIPLDEAYRQYPALRTYLEYHVTTKGGPMLLQGRPYVLDIITDTAPHVCIQKSVQCGITEIGLAIAYTTARDGRSVLYVLPGYPERNRFVSDRVDKQMARSPYYAACLKSAGDAMAGRSSDAKTLKHFGAGVLHFVGSNTEGEFSQFPADLLVIDERDLCNPANLGMAIDRLSESTYKRIYSIGNPRRPGAHHTVGFLYERSDRKKWFVRCGHCGTEQVLDWYDHFVENVEGVWRLRDSAGRPRCTTCLKPFNRLERGRWIATQVSPARGISGYQISKLFTPSADILELYERFIHAQHNETAMQRFHESELGLYYMPKSSALTLAMLQSCIAEDMSDWATGRGADGKPDGSVVIMGVDVGAVLHVKASRVGKDGVRRAAYIGTLAGFADLMNLCNMLKPECIVIDALPEVHKVAEFTNDCPYPVWACTFGSNEMTTPFETNWDQETGRRVVRANRTAVMDAAFAAIATKRVVWPAHAEGVDQFFYQMSVPVRTLDPTAARGAGRFIWTKGEDHYRLADTYEGMAMQILENNRVEFTWVR